MFRDPPVIDSKYLGGYIRWDVPLEQEIIEMLVGKHQFSESRVAKHIRLLQQARQLFPEPDQVEERQGFDPPPEPIEADKSKQIEKEIIDFVKDENNKELSFPPTLSNYERRLVHILASRHHLSHESFGEPGARYVVIKRTAKTAPPEEELKEDVSILPITDFSFLDRRRHFYIETANI